MHVTLEVGPRILGFGRVGGPNEMCQFAKDAGRTGGDVYHSFGGHRLWIAPEEDPKTMQPDNAPVETGQDGPWNTFRSATDRYGMQKEIAVQPDAALGGFRLRHRIYNRGVYAATLAPWALSVMAVGGECLFPQHPFVAHSDQVLPTRPLVLWGYTDMTDPRWTWGKRLIRLRQDAERGPQKVGMLIQQGWAAYANHGNLFLKHFPYDPAATYPDYGCNFETFTRQDMLEVESVGALQTVAPGAYAEHLETWYLVPGVTVPGDDDAAADLLESLVAARPSGF